MEPPTTIIRVDPGVLHGASAVVRGGYDDSALHLARAVVRDLLDGVGAAERTDVSAVFGAALPRLVELVGQRGRTIAGELNIAADGYHRADRLPPVAPAARR